MGWNLGYLNFLLLLLLNPNLPYFYPLKVPFSLSPHTLFPAPLFYFYLIVYFSQRCALSRHPVISGELVARRCLTVPPAQVGRLRWWGFPRPCRSEVQRPRRTGDLHSPLRLTRAC